MTKSYILLCLFEALSNGQELKIHNCCKEYAISVPTFRRYIAELRDFYCEKSCYEVVYDTHSQSYKLKNRTDV